MLTDATIDRELASYWERLLSCAHLVAAGKTAAVTALARSDLEDLICLAEEAPEARQAECQYLLERYEALMQRLAN